ncbi:hypothetical protein [Aidingimonas lacisalsi]|uniref:hypothetical protein n=1 Tax=Aidingimonas lacisalsi TaxID=2604086 RepID=UPI0011D28784|nr:hypothetical protein [Aidingimonas lacisalsi]
MLKKLAVLCFSVPLTVLANDLTALQSKELTVFAGKSMGSDAEVSDIKKVMPRKDINELVATGININGFLCASVTDIRAMKVKSVYEVTCIAYRNGTAKKTYMVDALKGIAFEP